MIYETQNHGLSAARPLTRAPNSEQTFIDAVNLADERTSVLLERLSGLADKLVGSVPQEVRGNDGASAAVSLFDSVTGRSLNIARRADAGLEIISRIENALP